MVIWPNTLGEITQNYCEKLNVDEVDMTVFSGHSGFVWLQKL